MNNLNYGINTNTLPNITVTIRASCAISRIHIQVMLDDKVSSMIEKYRNLSVDRDDTKKFFNLAKALNPCVTLEEEGITEGASFPKIKVPK